jgi:hypothetical protein
MHRQLATFLQRRRVARSNASTVASCCSVGDAPPGFSGVSLETSVDVWLRMARRRHRADGRAARRVGNNWKE